jgi:hypothetical protein
MAYDIRKNIDCRYSENGVPKEIFCLKKEEVTGGWRQIDNEELCKL